MEKRDLTNLDIEKFLITRGILEPAGGDINALLKTQKERESYSFVTEGSFLAGADFQLDDEELKRITDHLVDLDTINEI